MLTALSQNSLAAMTIATELVLVLPLKSEYLLAPRIESSILLLNFTAEMKWWLAMLDSHYSQ